MDGEETQNGQRNSCQLQRNEGGQHKWRLVSKHKANRRMQQTQIIKRIV